MLGRRVSRTHTAKDDLVVKDINTNILWLTQSLESRFPPHEMEATSSRLLFLSILCCLNKQSIACSQMLLIIVQQVISPKKAGYDIIAGKL